MTAGTTAVTTKAQGDALENLVAYVFGTVPGITLTRRDAKNAFKTEEIDLAFWNERDPSGLFFLPHIILVECKNWSSRVGSEHVSWFDTKLRSRGLSFGVLVAVNGITGKGSNRTEAHSVIAKALSEQRQLIVITADELRSLTTTDALIHLLKEKLCDLAVSGGLA
ncbi:MAG: restriction endonuclease [candidate division NC10 bacterium]|nr:restriction endonuclease [candidate division NC10 bacterium]